MNDDTKDMLKASLAKEVQTFELDPVVLEAEVQRELTARAVKRIADKVEKAENPGKSWVTW